MLLVDCTHAIRTHQACNAEIIEASSPACVLQHQAELLTCLMRPVAAKVQAWIDIPKDQQTFDKVASG